MKEYHQRRWMLYLIFFLARFVNQEFSEGYIPTIFENLEHTYEFEGSPKILR